MLVALMCRFGFHRWGSIDWNDYKAGISVCRMCGLVRFRGRRP